MQGLPAYGLWILVILNSLVFIIFAFSFVKPKTSRDWRSFSAFSAFIVALFAEMYGFPLTMYLLSGWLQTRYPEIDILAHNSGHLWQTIFGWKGNAHFNPIHIVSNILLLFGFIMLASAWNVLFHAQKDHQLATTGLYERIRHPQYVAFTMILIAFLLMWPTILTIVMFPILLFMYIWLAKKEESESIEEFGEEYLHYIEKTPAFFPRRKTIKSMEIDKQ